MLAKVYSTTAAQRRAQEQYRLRNADKVRADLRERQRARAAQFYEGRSCVVCGEDHPAAISFHHRNKEEKRFGISNAISRRDIPDEEIWAEIAKCDVLCHNCHAKEHWENGGKGSRKPRQKKSERAADGGVGQYTLF